MVMVSKNKNGSLVVIVQVENTTSVFGPWQVLTKLFNDRKSHDSQGHQRNVSISCLQQAKIKIFHDNSSTPQQRQRKWFYGRNLRPGLTCHKKLPILLSFSPFFQKSNFSLRTQIDLGTKRLFSMFFVSIEWLFSYSI